ncbi:MAG: Hsp20/alpha crystallin family [Acidobacteriota bacterium]|jgi:HSP20 family molecular chaperone IbpA
MQSVTVHAVAEHEKASRPVFQRAEVSFRRVPGQFEISVGLPGFEARQVEVTATPGEIAIHAARQDEQRSEEVLQRFVLPELVRTDQVNATFQDGVLRVVAPCSHAGGGPPVPVAAA